MVQDEERSALELLLRTLQITEAQWRATLEAYEAELPPAPPQEAPADEVRRCLDTLAVAYRRCAPLAAAPASIPGLVASQRCPACDAGLIAASVVRGHGPEAIAYGRCGTCGHGLLIGTASPDVADLRLSYASAAYYEHRDGRGVGYDAYTQEAGYREAKGARLVERLQSLAGGELRTLLEVGSGYGFTRAAAERAGLSTAGVDLNPHACAEARRRYGLSTFPGTLQDALQQPSSGIGAGAWDVVLYQFVLEHVLSLSDELKFARRALRRGGLLVLLVPSMEAVEIDVFGGSYRSFRADHIHLLTRASTRALLAGAGFAVEVIESTCNLHLFRAFLSPAALEHVYTSGRGPDLFVVGRSLP